MPENEVKRNYTITDGELSMLVSNYCLVLARDLSDMSSFGLTQAKITALNSKGNAFEQFPSDEYCAGLQMLATENKNNLLAQLMNVISQMAWRVETKWGVNSKQYKMLAVTGIYNQQEDTVLRLARSIYQSMLHFLPDLTDTGLTQTMLDDFKTLIDNFEISKNEQFNTILDREAKAQVRIEKGNELYKEIISYCELGKKLYANVNPAKYNDYVIYGSAEGGKLVAPTGLIYIRNDGMMSWDPVVHATSYQLERSTTGSEWEEYYAGSETTFSVVPEANTEYYYRCRARNSGGYGPYSEVYRYTFYTSFECSSELQG